MNYYSQSDKFDEAYDKFRAPKAFTIIEEDSVVDEVEAAVAKHQSAHDVFEAAKWRIARSPESGQPIPGTNPEKRVLVLPSFKIVKSPKLVVRYYFEDDDHITVDWIKFYPFNEKGAVAPPAYVYK